MKKNKNVALFIVTLFVIALITGFIFGYNKEIDITDYLETLSSNNNLFFVHTISIIAILLGTLSLINLIGESIILGVEGISSGFLLAIFFKTYKINGLIFALVNILINKGFFLLLLSYLFIVSFRFMHKTIKNITGVNNDYVKSLYKPLFQKFALILVVSLINDTIIYFFGNMLLKNLTFML